MEKKFSAQAYHHALTWLDSLVHTPGRTIKTNKKARDDVVQFLSFLGNPHKSYKTILITGTSGKGSTAAMLSSLFKQMNYRIGLHINPYVQIPNEKLIVNDTMISPNAFIALIKETKQQYQQFLTQYPDKQLNYGQMWTVLTYFFFKQQRIDIALFELAIGKRISHANVVQPLLSIITNIDYDHEHILGRTLSRIAWNKSGIIHTHSPVVTAETKREALNTIVQEAHKKAAPLYTLSRDFTVQNIQSSLTKTVFDYSAKGTRVKNIIINHGGAYQAYNAGLAIAAANVIARQENKKLSPALIKKAINKAVFPFGRMEVMQKNPLLILDGAHNAMKLNALAQTLARLKIKGSLIMVLGILKTKNIKRSLTAIGTLPDIVIATEPHVIGKEALTHRALKKAVQKLNSRIPVASYKNPSSAIKHALTIAKKNDAIVVTGSLYLLEDARGMWIKPQTILKTI